MQGTPGLQQQKCVASKSGLTCPPLMPENPIAFEVSALPSTPRATGALAFLRSGSRMFTLLCDLPALRGLLLHPCIKLVGKNPRLARR